MCSENAQAGALRSALESNEAMGARIANLHQRRSLLFVHIRTAQPRRGTRAGVCNVSSKLSERHGVGSRQSSAEGEGEHSQLSPGGRGRRSGVRRPFTAAPEPDVITTSAVQPRVERHLCGGAPHRHCRERAAMAIRVDHIAEVAHRERGSLVVYVRAHSGRGKHGDEGRQERGACAFRDGAAAERSRKGDSSAMRQPRGGK